MVSSLMIRDTTRRQGGHITTSKSLGVTDAQSKFVSFLLCIMTQTDPRCTEGLTQRAQYWDACVKNDQDCRVFRLDSDLCYPHFAYDKVITTIVYYLAPYQLKTIQPISVIPRFNSARTMRYRRLVFYFTSAFALLSTNVFLLFLLYTAWSRTASGDPTI